MSSRKSLVVSALLAAGLLAAALTGQSDDSDPVLEYYWQKAREAAPTFDPNVPGVSYRLAARSYWHSTRRDGTITRTDSVMQNLYYTGGVLDSITTVSGNEDRFRGLDVGFPLVFEMDFHRSLFPNDTGGIRLAIGLTADSTRRDDPDGLAVIDRYRYHLHSLYLCYPEKTGYRRFTRAYRFKLVDDYLFPDSVWEVATKLGIFSSESYRLETGITDIEVWPTEAPDSP